MKGRRKFYLSTDFPLLDDRQRHRRGMEKSIFSNGINRNRAEPEQEREAMEEEPFERVMEDLVERSVSGESKRQDKNLSIEALAGNIGIEEKLQTHH